MFKFPVVGFLLFIGVLHVTLLFQPLRMCFPVQRRQSSFMKPGRHRQTAAVERWDLPGSKFSIQVLDRMDGAPAAESIQVWWITEEEEMDLRLVEILSIQTARGSAQIAENRGLFTVQDNIWSRTNDFSVDSVTIQEATGENDASSVTVRGELREWSYFLFLIPLWSTPVLQYSLVFSTVPESTQQLAFVLHLRSLDGTSAAPDEYNRVFLLHDSTSGEKFFGFGEQFTYLDLKGKAPTIVTSENGVGRGTWHDFFFGVLFYWILQVGGNYDSSYAPMPYYMTNTGRAMVLENYEISQFDLTQPNSVTVKVLGAEMRGRWMHGSTPLDIIETFTEYTGRMQPLPDWMNNGAIVGMQGGTDKVLSTFAKLQELEAPVGAFWLQDWVGNRPTSLGTQLWWNWVLNENRYPGWSEMVSQLQSKGVRMMTYISPFLADVTELSNYDGSSQSLFQIARDGDFLVKNTEGNPYLIPNTDFDAGLVDLSKADAREWYKGIIKTNVIGVGASGYMADFGEALPLKSVLGSGESPEVYHNKFPEAWQLLNKEAVAELNRTGDIVFFTRSGFTKTPGLTTLNWAGDQTTSWDENDGLKSAIIALLSSGLSGISINHSDIGGWFAVSNSLLSIEILRTRELFFRWTEMNAFTAVYRTHDGVAPLANVQFYTDDETYQHFATFAKVYAALAFHRSTLMQEAAERGYPVVRHPFLHYPNDARAYELRYQWMLGADIMVAPVTDQGQTRVSVYLPEGSWTHVWTQQTYAGGTDRVINAPIGQPPVFYKTGGAVGTQFITNLQKAGVI